MSRSGICAGVVLLFVVGCASGELRTGTDAASCTTCEAEWHSPSYAEVSIEGAMPSSGLCGVEMGERAAAGDRTQAYCA